MDRPVPPLPGARSHRRIVAIVSLAIAAALGSPAPASAQGAPAAGDAARARELYKKGRKAYDDGNMREAYEAYLAAWKLQKSFDIAGNLAGVELATARYRDAADHLKFALANLPVSGDADKRRTVIEGLLRDAKRQIGTLSIKVSPDAAEVSLDGRALPKTDLADEIYVDPGEHVVSATAPDHAPREQKVQVSKGAFTPVIMVLAKIQPTTVTPVTPPGPSPITVAGFITSGLGLAAGTAFAIVSKTRADAAQSQYEALQVMGPRACAGKNPSEACQTLQDARASRDGFANAALWTFVGAAAVAGGTLVYTFVVPRQAPKASGGDGAASGPKPGALRAPAAASISALPIVSPQGGGLVINGSF